MTINFKNGYQVSGSGMKSMMIKCSNLKENKSKKIKVMTKTEEKRLKIKKFIELLENKYDAYDFEDGDGGRIEFAIDGKNKIQYGEFHRRDLEVFMHGNVRLAGNGWTPEEYANVEEAKELEYLLNSTNR